MADPDLAFVPVTHAHLPLLRAWMEQPHWREWWGEPETELSYIVDMIEGRDSTRPYLFHANGKTLGYIQYWYIEPHQTEEWARDHPWLMELPSDTVGVDLSIGDVTRLGQGLGTRALRAFVDRLLRDGHKTIVIDPDPLNTRAVTAYRKAGFRPVPHLENRTPGVIIMQFQHSNLKHVHDRLFTA